MEDQNKNKNKNVPANEVTEQTLAEQKSKEETVEVPKNLLQGIIDTQKNQDKKIKELESENKRLVYAADKGRLGVYDSRRDEDIIRRFSLATWTYENKQRIVIGWYMVKDEVMTVYEDGRRRVIENQIIMLLLDNGKDKEIKVEIPYPVFATDMKKIFGDVVASSKRGDEEYKTLRLEDGREIEINIKFVNL